MAFNSLLSFVGALLCGGLAASVFFKNTRSFVHWTFAAGMVALALKEVFAGMGAQATLPSEVIRWERLGLGATAFIPGSWLLFSLSFARSNYKELVSRWKWFTFASFALPLTLVTFFTYSLFAVTPRWDGSSLLLIPLGWSGYVFYLFLLLCSVAILVNLEETLRASTGSKRWQIKFMVLGLGSLFAVQIYTISQTLLFSSVNAAMEVVNSYAVIVADILIVFSLVRNRLLDVDIYLSQRFLYNSITVLVVGIYLLAVGILAKAISYLGGSKVLPLGTFFVFLALLGLTVVLLSDQLRQEIKRFISRNLYRSHYDYRKEWMMFTQRTTSLVDIKDLCTAVSKMVSETFGVSSVTIWLLDEPQGQLSLGGSTALSDVHARDLRSGEKGSGELVRYMRAQQAPVDFDMSPDAEAKTLIQSYPDYFRDARIRYCISLVAGRQVVGLMTLNDRITKEPFSVEDFDLLKTIADQAAGSLLTLTLSQCLMKAKEMEAFQTLSAFFIHDLKNLASMLSLTVQNLPTHYNNPEFRNDALRVISESVAKMNAMCGHLSLMTKKLELHQTEGDLNELVTTTLMALEDSIKASLIRDLRPVPRLAMDPDQIQKVLLNLVLNANEAVGNGGEIRVETDQMEGWAVLSVSDNGCGMSSKFIERSLFQPFHTTKSQGLGIGLFHSKQIVEAHRGRIEVKSEEGKGSTFSVLLPVLGVK